VGDEPLLLARIAPTFVARDRVAGAGAAGLAGASLIVMDDGFQNPSLQKDFSVLVVDARRGVGNGRVIPAGPLRAPLHVQLMRADALIVVGASPGADEVAAAARACAVPVFHAALEPDAAAASTLMGARVLAFAGIGDPEKLFETLVGAGIAVVASRGFPDHHRYTPAEADRLCDQAERETLVLVTTEKDLARMQGDEGLAVLAARARALPVTFRFADEAGFLRLLQARLARARAR
jgi:tetraacyldisaccharide 4'-kinase